MRNDLVHAESSQQIDDSNGNQEGGGRLGPPAVARGDAEGLSWGSRHSVVEEARAEEDPGCRSASSSKWEWKLEGDGGKHQHRARSGRVDGQRRGCVVYREHASGASRPGVLGMVLQGTRRLRGSVFSSARRGVRATVRHGLRAAAGSSQGNVVPSLEGLGGFVPVRAGPPRVGAEIPPALRTSWQALPARVEVVKEATSRRLPLFPSPMLRPRRRWRGYSRHGATRHAPCAGGGEGRGQAAPQSTEQCSTTAACSCSRQGK